MPNEPRGFYICERCGREFGYKAHRSNHLRVCQKIYSLSEMIKLGEVCLPDNLESECWMWVKGVTDKTPYGRHGKEHSHRFVYKNYFNVDITGLVVCHMCDTPGCVNPGHLVLGTQSDNIKDSFAKGRSLSPMSRNHPKYIEAKEKSNSSRGEHYMRRPDAPVKDRLESMMKGRGIENWFYNN